MPWPSIWPFLKNNNQINKVMCADHQSHLQCMTGLIENRLRSCVDLSKVPKKKSWFEWMRVIFYLCHNEKISLRAQKWEFFRDLFTWHWRLSLAAHFHPQGACNWSACTYRAALISSTVQYVAVLMMMYMLAAVTMVLCVTVAQSRWEDGKTYLYSYEAASTVGGTAALDSANVGKISVRL